MAVPVPTLVGSIVETASDGTIAVPNTVPPAVGDYLVAFVAAYASGGSRSINTPSGWTLRQDLSGDDNPYAVFTKTAVLADTSAGSFSFSLVSGGADVFTGAIIKASNIAVGLEVAGSEEDIGTTSHVYTTNLTPTSPDSIILSFYIDAQNSSGGGTFSGYTSTPSLTWTEIIDAPGNNSSPSMSFAVAYAAISGFTNITQRSATQSNTPSQAKSVAIILNGYYNQTGTNGLLSVSPAIFQGVAHSDTNGTSALLEVSPNLPTQSGEATEPTVWTLTAKP